MLASVSTLLQPIFLSVPASAHPCEGFGGVFSIRLSVSSRTFSVSASVRSFSTFSGFFSGFDMAQTYLAPRLKIARAKSHIEELDQEIGSYLSREPFVLIVEKWKADPGTGTNAWTARIREPLPRTLAPILGDVIHNLRTSLDLLASDLVRANGEDPTKVHFPFSNSFSELPGQIKGKGFHKAGHAAVALLKELQPYKGGNLALRAIHDMDIRDKHQELLPVSHGVTLDLSGLTSKDATDKAKAQLANWSSQIERDGQEIVLMPAAWGPPLGTKIKATYLFALDEPLPIGGVEIIAALQQFSNICEGVIGEFEKIARI